MIYRVNLFLFSTHLKLLDSLMLSNYILRH